MKYNHVVCGGTFDHLHLGHKKLIEECLRQGNRVTVGITTGAMIRHKAYSFSLESYRKRVKNVSQFNPSLSLYKLSDIYGPTLTDVSIDAICVTEETLPGAKMINKKRNQIGMRPLSILLVPFVYDENNEKISSERIRQGAIDKEGIHYYKYLFSKEKHILPKSLRGALRKPLGRIISLHSYLPKRQIERMKDTIVKNGYYYHCAVGDVVSLRLKKRGISPFISIVDGKTRRKALNSTIMESLLEKDRSEAINEKGTIQKSACLEMEKLFTVGHKGAIKQLFIHGEEDLLTLVAVLLAPLGAHVWYGQQGMGAVDVHVTEKKKQIVYNLLKQFNGS